MTKRRTKAEREAAQAIETQLLSAIDRGIRERADDWRRDHLGGSMLGHKCDRYLWLSFRWAMNPEHDGRQLRLFARGDREEPALVADLEAAGCTVFPHNVTTGEQWRADFSETVDHREWWHLAHLGGSLDGVVQIPGESLWRLLEFKTHNRKSFDYLKQKKVRSAKREHWAQMQVYMRGFVMPAPHQERRLEGALYVAVCKDTDEIYVELVDRDDDAALDLINKGVSIVGMNEPPPKMDPAQIPCVYTSKDGTRWPCDFFDLCHGDAMPERNCRTCVQSTPGATVDGERRWTCAKHNLTLSPEDQRLGCPEQQSIPPIVNAQVAAVFADGITYRFADGAERREECEPFADPGYREGIEG